ncbi:MAG: hypothetical protein M3O28_15000 [Actinomycetota bacterium]|nr:hypothetical protein [Actinomycetota bacterium]
MTAGADRDPLAERPGILGWLGVLLVCASMALSGLLELFLVPLYAGRFLVPITLVLVVVANVTLPRLAATCVGSLSGAVLAFLSWLAPTFYLGASRRPEGDVILPGGGYVQWVAYGVLFGGAIAGAVAVAMSVTGPRNRASQPPAPAVRTTRPRPQADLPIE